MKLSRPQLIRHRRGISLIESLMSVAAISVLASIIYLVATNVLGASANSRFERDVATINAAVRTYIATGGNLNTASSSSEVIDRLKQSLSNADREQQVGSGGSLIDSRLTPVFVAANEHAGQSRVVWDSSLQRFALTHDAVAGIAAFAFTNPTEETGQPADDTQRQSSVSYAPPGGWVWLHEEAPQPERMQFTPITTPGNYGGPGTPPPTPTRLTLTPPSYSIPTSTLPLSAYPLPVTVTDTNPPSTSMQLIGINAASLTYNPVGHLVLEPGDSVHAIASSADPDNWVDSAYVSETYSVSPHNLQVAWLTPQPSVTYAEVGGAMIGHSPQVSAAARPTPVITNLDTIHPSYISSNNFQLRWLHGPANPRSAHATELPDFSGTVPTLPSEIDLAHWGNKSSLRFRTMAVALDTGFYATSTIADITLTAAVTNLRAPLISAHPDTPTTYNSIHIDLETSFGDTPVGARIFYTTDGTEPGLVTPSTNATRYTEPFIYKRDLCATTQLRARVYPPVGFSQWFDTSAETLLVRPPLSDTSDASAWLCNLSQSGLCQFAWFVVGDGASVTESAYTIDGPVGVGPGAHLDFENAPPNPLTIFADPTATVTGGPAGTPLDLNTLADTALALNATGLALTPTQTFGIVDTSTTLSATAPDGINVVSIDELKIKSDADVFTISGTPDDYFIINIGTRLDFSGGGTLVLDGVPPTNVVININIGSFVKLSGQSLVVGATILSPMAGVAIGGNASLTGHLTSGGTAYSGQGDDIYGSWLHGNGSISRSTALGCQDNP